MAKKVFRRMKKRLVFRKKKTFGVRTYMGKPTLKRFEYNQQIYMVYNTFITNASYTFSSNATQSSLTNYVNLMSFFTTSNEWAEIAGAYGLLNIYGIKYEFVPYMGGTYVYTASANGPIGFTPLYLDFSAGLVSSSVNNRVVANNDTALECIPFSTERSGKSKFYRFPPVMTHQSGYSTGSSVWLPFDSVSSNSSFYSMGVYLGQINSPSTNNTTDFIVPIGAVRASLYCKLAARQRIGG